MAQSLQNSNTKNSQAQMTHDENLTMTIPTVNFDYQNLIVSLNGSPIDYEQQILTPDGLEICLGQTKQGDNIKVLVDYQKSIVFEAKVHENFYCIELAKSLDRGSNSAYHLSKRSRKGTPNGNFFNFQICQHIIKKIPFKPRCFQTVFANLSSSKIALLLENDTFFIQILKYLCRVIFKVDLSEVESRLQISGANQNSEKQRKNTEFKQNCEKTAAKPQKQKKTTAYQKQVFEIYERIKANLNKSKFSFERINLLLSMFTRQNRLYNFLQEINKQIVGNVLKRDLAKVLSFQKQDNCSKKALTSEKLREQTLIKLILIIKTVHSSLGKSSISFEILKVILLENPQFFDWLSQNLERILVEKSNANKLIELFCLIVQSYPPFLATFYQSNQIPLNTLVHEQILWIYETLNTFYPSEEQEKQQHELAYTLLDSFSTICRIMIKEATSSVNIGRIICKHICETATHLRYCDIQMLTFVCCTNSYSRQNVMRYLFAYFRRFIRGVKSSFKGVLKDSVRASRKNKHHLLQIMQSIRKISQIQSIDLTLDSELIEDIDLILQTPKSTSKTEGIFRFQDRNDCVRSAYWAMLKSVKVENSKQLEQNSILETVLA